MAKLRKGESQNVEFKEAWRDEYLKWVCGFANAQGGVIYVGVDDAGNVVGLDDPKKLLEDVPNKIQAGLGVVADVNLKKQGGKSYLEIVVRPSAYPVSYHGEYHYRSGATRQQLTGMALSEFIMRRTGIHWEDVPVEGIGVDDLDPESFRVFRREALRRKRMAPEELNLTNAELLRKLNLLAPGGKLKRSAVLLFYHDPSVVQNGSHVQIGKFGQGPDLQYQDVLDGSLLTTADKVIDLIYLKYLKAKIDYEHDRRVETYPFARAAVREAVYNAMAHNCYMFGAPIQIRVEDEAMIISNCCVLPENWTVATLMEPHNSLPYNPDIARVFYRAGYIEHWGRGIEKICAACQELGAEPPRYELLGNSLRVHFAALKSALVPDSAQKDDQTRGGGVALKSNNVALEPKNVALDPGSVALEPENGALDLTDKTNAGNGEGNEGNREGNSEGNHGSNAVRIRAKNKRRANEGNEGNREGNVARVLDAMRKEPKATIAGLSKALSLSHATIERAQKALQADGRIRRVGGTRGHWEIVR